MPQAETFRVLVIFGGRSSERAVSLKSGRAVAGALCDAGHTVGTWDPAETPATELEPTDWDVAFPMLHGTGGEDGALHQQLAAIGLPWVGCSIAGSALTFDKSRTRKRLLEHGIRVPPGVTISRNDVSPPGRFPVVVKPARQGSSIGISIVRCSDEWIPALDAALAFCSDIVVESYVAGREVSVPVIEGNVFPAVEIIVEDGWYDYHNKYENNRTRYRVPAPDLPANLNTVAAQACEACGAKGILRVDFRIDDASRAHVLEINTIPGMTSHSLVPLSAAALELSLAELCDRCVRDRMRRAAVG
ncbi:MAG: D-alanine--D-alanine ligase [Planctomycetaceae bacterium]